MDFHDNMTYINKGANMVKEVIIEDKKFSVDKIVFYNSQSLWGVLGLKPLESLGDLEYELLNMYGTISACGSFPKPYENAEVKVSGEVVTNPQYGKQIKITRLELLQDTSSKEGIINYLAKGEIEGIGVQLAEKIYETFGDKSIDVVTENPDSLIHIEGIGKKTVAKVKGSLTFLREHKPTIQFLTGLGISYRTVMKLIEEFQEEAVSIIKTNAYEMLEVAKDMTFKQVDDIFLKAGGDPKSPVRLQNAFLYILRQQAIMEGSTGCVRSSLSTKFYSLLDLAGSEDYFGITMEQLEDEGKVVLGGGVYIYFKEYLDIEKSIAEKIISLQKSYIPSNKIDEEIVEEEIKNFPFTLNREQTKAVHEGLNTNVFVLTGAAGCVDGDTEYFNGKEWKPIKDYTSGELVLQYNYDGTANMIRPTRFIKNEANLYQMKNTIGSLDMVLSEDHRFIYVTSKGNINEKPFGEIMKIMKEKGSFSANIIPSFKCSDVLQGSLTPERLRLLIAISADGSLYKSGKFWRVRIIKERKIERLRKLISDVGLEVVEQTFADGYHNFKIPVEYGCKEFPDSFYFLSEELKQVFKEEVVLWDGSTKSGERNVDLYFTTIKKNADLVQFIFSQFGTRAAISIDNRVGEEHNGGYTYKSVFYTVRLTKEKFRSLNYRKKGSPPLSILPYKSKDGYQYCFQVPSGMLVLRRNNNIFVTGNCGKSSITKALYRIYSRCGFNVVLLSPTAKACRRLEECTGGIAQTIHKFLKMTKDEDFKVVSDYVKDTVLIIDEASMMDIILFNNLLKGATMSTRVILVGDNNQLPSVQAGNVLGDVIDSGRIHVSLLTDIMRQQENSSIIKYCSMINEGEVFEPVEKPDFLYEEFGTAEELKEKLLPLYKKEVEEVGLNEVQVIAPYKKGEIGMNNLNIILQNAINNEGKEVLGDYRIGDKVRHTQNNYKKDVFNGETGVIYSYDEDEDELMVDFGDRSVPYNHIDIEELTLSYCSTVHASQGSEYKVVFVILDDTSVNSFLHIRRLLYTAVSRGKQRVYILTKPYLVDRCIENNSYRPRITKLKDFLK